MVPWTPMLPLPSGVRKVMNREVISVDLGPVAVKLPVECRVIFVSRARQRRPALEIWYESREVVHPGEYREVKFLVVFGPGLVPIGAHYLDTEILADGMVAHLHALPIIHSPNLPPWSKEKGKPWQAAQPPADIPDGIAFRHPDIIEEDPHTGEQS